MLSDLESKGYAVQPFVVPACAVDAPHRRDRVWIIAAHTDSDSKSNGTVNAESGFWELGASNVGHADSSDISRHDQTAQQGRRQQGLAAGCQDVADANGERLQGHFEQQTKSADTFVGCGADVADTDGQRGRGGDAERQDASDAGQSSRCQRHDAKAMGAGVTEPSMGGTLSNGLSAWMDEPRDIPRVATGVKQRAARLKGLGNAIVPQIAMQIGLTIKAVEHG